MAWRLVGALRAVDGLVASHCVLWVRFALWVAWRPVGALRAFGAVIARRKRRRTRKKESA